VLSDESGELGAKSREQRAKSCGLSVGMGSGCEYWGKERKGE